MSRPDLTFPTVKLTLTPADDSPSDLDITTWIQSLSWNESNDSLNMLHCYVAGFHVGDCTSIIRDKTAPALRYDVRFPRQFADGNILFGKLSEC